ncbi:AMP-dependent synthetase [Sulfolobales archaeon HS-7]|nr:AMP-dependent synthetase [Sulfolobales archaeon HS-7]
MEVLDRSISMFGDRYVLTYFGKGTTYRDFGNLVKKIAGGLSELVSRGDVVAISMNNIPQFVIAEYAIWSLGGVVLPLNPLLSREEKNYLISDSKAKIAIESCEVRSPSNLQVIKTNPLSLGNPYIHKWDIPDCEEELLTLRGELPPLSPKKDDIALIVYTSGTTGRPKGVPITHSNIFASSLIYNKWFLFSPEDVVLGIAPFYHITGEIFHITSMIMAGGKISMHYKFEPEMSLLDAEKNKTTVTMAVATAYIAMLRNLQGDIESMRLWSSGGMAMPRSVEEEWKKKTGSWIYMAWGLTETTSPATLWPYPYTGPLPVDPETGVVSSGIPVYNTEIDIRDGEIFVRGPQVVKGYLYQEGFPGGWLPTGDLGKLINGWVYVIDRKKDIINTSGFKVIPREVEEVIYSHPCVEEVAVVGLPDEYRGERVVAFVKPRGDCIGIENSIITLCREKLTPYKVPREVFIVDEIPKNASGKVLRRALREKK